MIFFHQWLDEYKKSKFQYINFQIDNFSQFRIFISDSHLQFWSTKCIKQKSSERQLNDAFENLLVLH